MAYTKLAVAAATISLLAGSAFAGPNVVGAWKGKIKIDMSKLPKAANPQMQAMMQKQLAMVKAASLYIDLQKNGSYTAGTKGMGQDEKKDSGTWKVSGSSLTLTSSKEKSQSHAFKLSKDGKTFSTEVPGGSVVFTR
jgi:hypothetical protein